MTKWEKMIEDFKALTAEQKQKKLLAIFDFAKDKFDFSETAINYLSSDTLPSELVMVKLYEFVVNATTIAEERIQKKQTDVKKNFQEQEKQSEAQDAEDADKLLNLIDLL